MAIKSKHISNAWLTIHGLLSKDHQYFSKFIQNKLIEAGPFILEDHQEELNLSLRRIKKLLSKRPTTQSSSDRKIIAHGHIHTQTHDFILNNAGKTFYTKCPWDALCTPHLLESEVLITGRCHLSKSEVSIKASPYGFEVDNEDVYISFKEPEQLTPHAFEEIENWNYLFFNKDIAENWVSSKNDLILLPLAQTFQIASWVTTELYKDTLKPL